MAKGTFFVPFLLFKSFKNMENEKNISKDIFEWIEELAIAIMLIVVLFSFLFRVITVSGESMFDNYYDGDRLIVTTLTGEIKQGDVVVIIDALEKPIIKRVIATEGQTVDIDNSTGTVYVDGEELDNTQFDVENGITYTSDQDASRFPLTVPEGCVFVLGDNRVVSLDSRYAEVGTIPTEKILGKSIVRIYPFSRIGTTN